MVRPGSPTPLWGAAGKAGYALSCVAAALVLAVSGFFLLCRARREQHRRLARDQQRPVHRRAEHPADGAGKPHRLERQRLPNDILNALHAGSRQGVLYEGVGGNATNTLILIHIPAGGKKAIGFSIPRDDWVTFPETYDGQHTGKIDQAYGDALAEKESEVRQQHPNMSQSQVAFQGNEAGRAATVATVESFTGVHIDHFAEINLDGFYELAKVLGGVQVCLKHPVALDTYSGFYAKKAGYQHLNAKMALAFVRQRHGLINGDLDRTHRQQAFLASVMQQLRTEGVLGDLTKINSLLSVAKQYVITDSGWNLLDFATQMRSLTSGSLSFNTLPIQSYITIEGQSANQVDVPYIQQLVHNTFYPAPRPPGSSGPRPTATATVSAAEAAATTVDVYNGGSTPGLAGDVSAALVKDGFKAGQVSNTTALPATQVLYGTGAAASGAKIASLSTSPRRRAPQWHPGTSR
jgi:cell envelope-related function transcriptional attenuator common domain